MCEGPWSLVMMPCEIPKPPSERPYMGIELERKFLLNSDTWPPAQRVQRFRQGYLATGPPVAVRVRVMDGHANINIKQATSDLKREEFEYPIPLKEAEEILERLCIGYRIEKTRHYVEYEGFTWEIDVFHGENAGLIVAEVEFDHENQTIALPPWIGEEVSSDPRYLNASLALRPYSQWAADDP